jgi:hypothetical protein
MSTVAIDNDHAAMLLYKSSPYGISEKLLTGSAGYVKKNESPKRQLRSKKQ